ncbi:hypothetical protein ID866_11992 [Astraeus odoratus]|nr:hypothetical protein ID866_11992 [Astraeus odoratus]
MKIPMKKLCGY